ncbi:serine hydrolase [Mucilaginibacter flavidus]|uniref:serine hydrolase n=1 Tax=Mucilaginibacter flavidus TaxID=2949309 RepID=UPI00209368F9|nr:serine hydrolase [Mucilaginibacter flavidus]MCO5947892.1 serine hydrolase [Mucilaginibacter flavidus]
MKQFITFGLYSLISLSHVLAQDKNKAARLMEISRAVNLPGVQLVYTKNNKSEVYNLGTIENGNAQKVTSNTIFEAASLSKCVFAYAVLRLHDRGLIDLDKPLLNYIGKYDHFDQTDPRYGKITARIVLSHKTGLPNWSRSGPANLMFPPDSCFSYSGEGFVFLQRTVEKITGKTLNQLADEEVFVPLKMTSSSYEWTNKFDTVSAFGNSAGEVKRHSDQNAAYSLLTNAHDYSLFLQAVAGGEGLKPATHQLMLAKATAGNWFMRKPTEAMNHIWWGLGVGLQENEKGKAFWHWGDNGAFKAFYIDFPDRQESLVYFTHDYRGLFIVPGVVDLFLGKQTTWAVKWIEEGYNSPYAVKAYSAELAKRGFENAAGILEELKKKDAGFKVDEHDMNEFGFILMEKGKYKEAIAIFKLNINRYPNSGNLYDSLAEAYVKTGDKTLAMENFKKCIELNPKNEYAAEQLKKLE